MEHTLTLSNSGIWSGRYAIDFQNERIYKLRFLLDTGDCETYKDISHDLKRMILWATAQHNLHHPLTINLKCTTAHLSLAFGLLNLTPITTSPFYLRVGSICFDLDDLEISFEY
jgi:hypothetical protein